MSTTPVPIKIGSWEFDHASYDAENDVLYLSIGGPRAGYGEESPEGHIWRFDENDEFYGVTLIGVKGIMDAEGTVRLTLPPRPPTGEEIPARDLAPALVPA